VVDDGMRRGREQAAAGEADRPGAGQDRHPRQAQGDHQVAFGAGPIEQGELTEQQGQTHERETRADHAMTAHLGLHHGGELGLTIDNRLDADQSARRAGHMRWSRTQTDSFSS